VINFISNLSPNVRSGGFSAINAAAFAALSQRLPVHYAGPVDPGVVKREKAVSKFLRTVGGRGDFFFFSQSRLEAIAREVEDRCAKEAKLDFFHGFTPWILTRPKRPYVAWSDATFHDYIEIYHTADHFRSDDLRRIQNAEGVWLRNAEQVLFTNLWAAQRAVKQYELDPARVATVGIFGEIEMPDSDRYAGGREFAFIATNFERKGGRLVLDAFRRVRKTHPDAALIVVGEKPSDLSVEPGLTFAGYLRKENPEEFRRYRDILSRARAVVNATRSDISPLLPIEAGYFGCPAISSRRYAIPELVDDRRTGLLLNDASNADELAAAMTWMLDEEPKYRAMRIAAWTKTRQEHSKERFELQLVDNVLRVLGGEANQSITTAP
jgi:glycosyltransferase involved in cell wall biosynthesis